MTESGRYAPPRADLGDEDETARHATRARQRLIGLRAVLGGLAFGLALEVFNASTPWLIDRLLASLGPPLPPILFAFQGQLITALAFGGTVIGAWGMWMGCAGLGGGRVARVLCALLMLTPFSIPIAALAVMAALIMRAGVKPPQAPA